MFFLFADIINSVPRHSNCHHLSDARILLFCILFCFLAHSLALSPSLSLPSLSPSSFFLFFLKLPLPPSAEKWRTFFPFSLTHSIAEEASETVLFKS